jgi:hypothetical protein
VSDIGSASRYSADKIVGKSRYRNSYVKLSWSAVPVVKTAFIAAQSSQVYMHDADTLKYKAGIEGRCIVRNLRSI